ncbi:hypothetical protein SAMN05421779_101260 [Insolitispirillum peregrinum]|uniref:Uncharacterized protein n=1 Tax=Insolitispirillum peregrinum TaxID=80876 RepID=A0A1N7IKD4_9PROT|nr:hypothetical protein SAMN05421779_101260 [Insolitispirillum peregrinum]
MQKKPDSGLLAMGILLVLALVVLGAALVVGEMDRFG